MDDYPSLTNNDPPLHKLLRRRRLELRLLQANVADRLDVTPEAVVLWEQGRRRPELGKIPRIARILQLDPKDLCLRALQEYHPAFFRSLFGPPDCMAANMNPAA
jgi:transcriptional regulator with XRE-family HTH domain